MNKRPNEMLPNVADQMFQLLPLFQKTAHIASL